MTKRIIDTNEQSAQLLAQLNKATEMLALMVIEAVDEHPTYLLSPVMREMLVDKAKELNAVHSTVKHALCLDWPLPSK